VYSPVCVIPDVLYKDDPDNKYVSMMADSTNHTPEQLAACNQERL